MGVRKSFARIKEQMSQNPGTWTLYVVLRLIVVLVAVRCAWAQRWEQLFLCVVVLILMVLPSLLARRLKLELPSTLEKIILLFVFAAEILGEIGGYYQVISPTMGSTIGLKAFAAAVVGGIGILHGSVVGGLVVGVAECLAAQYLGSNVRDPMAFVILILILIIKPTGLFGKKGVTKV